MELEFKTKNEKQILAAEYWIDNITEQLLYGGGKGGGKSFLGASLIFGDALIYPETHYFIARQELNDLVKFTIPTIYEVFKNWGIKLEDYGSYNGQDKAFYLNNGSKVYLISCKEIPSDPLYERFGSMQMTRGWIEEGGEVAEAARANLWLSVGRWKNDVYKLKKKLLITCNPKKGWMKRDFIDPWQNGTLEISKRFIPALATDNKYLSNDYVKSLSEEKDKIRRQRLWEGRWDYDEDENSLVSYDALSDTFSNTITKDGNKYLDIDVARLGRDRTVFLFWDGLELVKINQYQGQTTDKTEDLIRDSAVIERIPYSQISVDEDGVGGGIVDHLRGVKGFVANSSPLPTANEIRIRMGKNVGTTGYYNDVAPKRNFANLKSQCGFKLAELINDHKISFKVPEYRDMIMEELTALLKQKDIDKEGKLQLIPKDEVKQELGRSPDIGDAIIHRMIFELRKEATIEDPVEQKRVNDVIERTMSLNQSRSKMNSSK